MEWLLVFILAIATSAYSGANSYPDRCNSTKDVNVVASIFRHCNPNRDFTNCPQEGWLSLFKESDMQSGRKKHYNIINIGFNKGYNFATWLNVFAPSTNVDAKVWHESLKKVQNTDSNDFCGVCNDCNAPPFLSSRPVIAGQIEPALHMVGVDLNKHNIDLVTSVMQKVRDAHNISENRLTLKLIHAAGGSTSSVTATPDTPPNKLKVPKCLAGNELCKIPNPSEPTDQQAAIEFEYVDVVGIEDLIQHLLYVRQPTREAHMKQKTRITKPTMPLNKAPKVHHTDHMIDILHIDTEGNDCEVLKTAMETLKAQRVRALIFEYHKLGAWGTTQLKDVIEGIVQHNMECFFMGQNRLWPISGKCWDAQYEFHEWSNVMCILRSDPWHLAIQPIVRASPDTFFTKYNGTAARTHGAKEIFFLENDLRRGFNSWDAFVNKGFKNEDVKTVESCIMNELYSLGKPIM